MRLLDLIQGLDMTHRSGPPDAPVRDLTDDSRLVESGWLFVARESANDITPYIRQAIERGAAAIITPSVDMAPPDPSIPWYQAEHVDQHLAGTLAERFFDYPASRLSLIGVTGTNGKTTTALLIQHLLHSLGIQTGVIGTIHTDDGTPGGRKPATLTTPGAIELSRELARMARAGCKAVAAEISSHALEQGRAGALTFRVGVFTNLTQDHLDYHRTMDAYAKAKSLLFSQLTPDGNAVINRDDPYADAVLGECPNPVLWTSLAEHEARTRSDTCFASDITLQAGSSSATFVGPWGEIHARIPLVGRHNISNALQALAAAFALTGQAEGLGEAMNSLPTVPGRLERVLPVSGSAHALPTVLVDYAHTPDALENALAAVRPLTENRLIVVFGCGGDRDRTKRPKMAQAACRYADRIYLTSDNPRTEDPDAIIRDALDGIPDDRRNDLVVQPDRARAIHEAIHEAQPDDTVVLAGKGHEDYQVIGHEKIHFDDREQAAEALVNKGRERTTR
ncbi:MAG: UDP-N-acetylmuramoyl-L-alanyl-D-glutamate--2,6-diaminopimelate ligase [Phycisphaeraceae bacterium]